MTVTAAADAAVLLIDCGRISAPAPPPVPSTPGSSPICSRCWRRKPLSGGQAGAPVRPHHPGAAALYLEEQAARTGRATVTVPFDRQALADYLCVDRSALSRTIGALQREGVLTVRRDRFTLNF